MTEPPFFISLFIFFCQKCGTELCNSADVFRCGPAAAPDERGSALLPLFHIVPVRNGRAGPFFIDRVPHFTAVRIYRDRLVRFLSDFPD